MKNLKIGIMLIILTMLMIATLTSCGTSRCPNDSGWKFTNINK
jgi:hypothetical protein